MDKIQHLAIIKILSKLGKEGNLFNLMKTVYKIPTTSIIFNGEQLKAFPLRLDTRQVCDLLPLLLNIILQVLAKTIKQEKVIKYIQIGKKDIKLFTDDM